MDYVYLRAWNRMMGSAPNGFRQLPDGQHKDDIAAVERECTLVGVVQIEDIE